MNYIFQYLTENDFSTFCAIYPCWGSIWCIFAESPIKPDIKSFRGPVVWLIDWWVEWKGYWCRASFWQQTHAALLLVSIILVFCTCTEILRQLTLVWFPQLGSSKQKCCSGNFGTHDADQSMRPKKTFFLHCMFFGKGLWGAFRVGAEHRCHAWRKWWTRVTGQKSVWSHRGCQPLVDSCCISQICLCQTFIIQVHPDSNNNLIQWEIHFPSSLPFFHIVTQRFSKFLDVSWWKLRPQQFPFSAIFSFMDPQPEQPSIAHNQTRS